MILYDTFSGLKKKRIENNLKIYQKSEKISQLKDQQKVITLFNNFCNCS